MYWQSGCRVLNTSAQADIRLLTSDLALRPPFN